MLSKGRQNVSLFLSGTGQIYVCVPGRGCDTSHGPLGYFKAEFHKSINFQNLTLFSDLQYTSFKYSQSVCKVSRPFLSITVVSVWRGNRRHSHGLCKSTLKREFSKFEKFVRVLRISGFLHFFLFTKFCLNFNSKKQILLGLT